MKTKYYKSGEIVHGGGQAAFMGVVFTGTLISKINKQTATYQKNMIVMPGAFYKQSYEAIYCKDQAIVLILEKEVYKVIVKRLRVEMQTKERDQISDLLKSTFFTELYLKDKKAKNFFDECELQFFLDGQVIA